MASFRCVGPDPAKNEESGQMAATDVTRKCTNFINATFEIFVKGQQAPEAPAGCTSRTGWGGEMLWLWL